MPSAGIAGMLLECIDVMLQSGPPAFHAWSTILSSPEARASFLLFK